MKTTLDKQHHCRDANPTYKTYQALHWVLLGQVQTVQEAGTLTILIL